MNQSDSNPAPRRNGVIFVEGVRLIVVLLGALVGYEIGHHSNPLGNRDVIGLLIGAAVSYVIGGIVGRTLDRGLQRGVRLFRLSPPGEIFAAAIISTSGMILGLILGMALVAIVRSAYAFVITAGIVWVFAGFGWRLGLVKGRQIVAAAGLSRILNPPSRPLPGQALLVDASAVMDRFLLILGRNGLLPGGLVVPQFVVDHVQLMAESPDPVTSRRARRGLEGLEAMLNLSVAVDLAKDEVPEVDDPTTKLLTIGRRTGLRIGTCSAAVMEAAAEWDLAVVNLHSVMSELAPDHVPGERISVSLVKEGRQARQAVGYLPDGDMVVVNDATHLIDEGPVEITVLSTRPTSQGLMVFAKLAPPTEVDGASLLTSRRPDTGRNVAVD